MSAHPFGYIAVILIQQLLMVGMLWAIVHLVDRSRLERRHQSSGTPISNASASSDLAALAVRLSRTNARQTDPAPRPSKVREMQEERV